QPLSCLCRRLFSLRVTLLVFTTPAPPRCPLFPYTTLFRSRGLPVDPNVRRVRSLEEVFDYCERWQRSRHSIDYEIDGVVEHFLQDRKSTRLNSSHDQISYAVFCLKKKKQNRRRTYNPGNRP